MYIHMASSRVVTVNYQRHCRQRHDYSIYRRPPGAVQNTNNFQLLKHALKDYSFSINNYKQ